LFVGQGSHRTLVSVSSGGCSFHTDAWRRAAAGDA
jgi:hypothetical protein